MIEFVLYATMSEQQPPQISQQDYRNIDAAFTYLMSPQVVQDSGGRIPRPFSAQAAAGLLGSWAVETGDPNLMQLDVVERGYAAGRGLSQYTGPRRKAYDAQRESWMRTGLDPNLMSSQLLYFAQEYGGQHDPNGASLSGYTRAFDNPDRFGSASEASEYFTRTYFKPSIPHYDRRAEEAERMYTRFKQKQLEKRPTSMGYFI